MENSVKGFQIVKEMSPAGLPLIVGGGPSDLQIGQENCQLQLGVPTPEEIIFYVISTQVVVKCSLIS